MTRVSAPDKELLDQCAPVLAQAEAAMGYRPNDVLSLCHWPELLNSLGGLVQTVLHTGEVDGTLKRLIGIISSRTQGCTYCSAHASYGASQLGVEGAKVAAVFDFESSPLFNPASVPRCGLPAWRASTQRGERGRFSGAKGTLLRSPGGRDRSGAVAVWVLESMEQYLADRVGSAAGELSGFAGRDGRRLNHREITATRTGTGCDPASKCC